MDSLNLVPNTDKRKYNDDDNNVNQTTSNTRIKTSNIIVNTSSSWNNLCADIIGLICPYMLLRQMYSLALLNKHWKHAIYTNAYMWSHIELELTTKRLMNIFFTQNTKHICSVIKKIKLGVNKLQYNNVYDGYQKELMMTNFNSSKWDNVQEITIETENVFPHSEINVSMYIDTLMKPFNKIKTIHLHSFNIRSVNLKLVYSCLVKYAKIETIHFHDYTDVANQEFIIADNIRNLRLCPILYRIGGNVSTDEYGENMKLLYEWVKSMKHLKILDIIRSSSSKRNFEQDLLNHLPELTILKTKFLISSLNIQVHPILKQLPANIHTLELLITNYVRQTHLAFEMDNNVSPSYSISNLTMDGFENGNGDNLIDLVPVINKKFPNLTCLQLTNCKYNFDYEQKVMCANILTTIFKFTILCTKLQQITITTKYGVMNKIGNIINLIIDRPKINSELHTYYSDIVKGIISNKLDVIYKELKLEQIM